jgi:hypothetical protein
MAEKVQLKIYIERRVLDDLWRFIKAKYGRPYGALSLEVQKAIEHWLSERGPPTPEYSQPPQRARTPPERAGRGRVSPTVKALGAIVRDIVSVSRNEIPQQVVEKIIVRNAGGEGRTVKRYFKFLTSEYKILKPLKPIRDSEGRVMHGKYVYVVDVGEAEKLIGVLER